MQAPAVRLLALAASLLSLYAYEAQASQIPWWNIRLAQEQGPNVCVVEEVPGAKHHIWTECKYWNSREVCGVKPLLKYECCEGFQRVSGTSGCIGVMPLENILRTAQRLGARRFVDYLEKSQLSQELQSEGPYTLFVPSDEAFKALSRDRLARLESGDTDYAKSILEYHIAEGRITSSQFKADVLLQTKSNGHKLRVNKYSSRIETVNCALLQHKDQEASNGVVHVISDVLDPSVTVSRDLAELLVQDGRFHQLTQALDRSGLMEKLRSTEQSFTILAPSDEAFSKIRPSRLTNILRDKQALRALLENHILPHLICIPAIIGEHKVNTVGTNKVTFDCDQNGVKIEGKRLGADFTMGLNGAIHVINDVLVPNRAKSIVQILEEENLQFLQVVQFAGLEDSFENFGEYTMFIPSQAAMNSLPETVLNSFKSDKENARRFVLHHVTQGRRKTENLNNNQELISLNEGSPLRIHLYRSRVTPSTGPQVTLAVEGAVIQRPDYECINGVVHVISKALSPLNYTAGELLQLNGTYKIFLKAMENLSLENNEMGSTGTMFVPSDTAFQKIDRNLYDKMMSEPTYMTEVIQNHLSTTMVLSEALEPELYYDVPTHRSTLTVILRDGKMKVNNAEVLQRDILTSNGIVHIINEVLLPSQIARN